MLLHHLLNTVVDFKVASSSKALRGEKKIGFFSNVFFFFFSAVFRVVLAVVGTCVFAAVVAMYQFSELKAVAGQSLLVCLILVLMKNKKRRQIGAGDCEFIHHSRLLHDVQLR